ncbi:3'-5' exonuclease [Psychromonas sp. psych-6C06]|uniref:3'-5' exonuclease n=1 Tax=Psychromonas sp. psych-6C06 TaxID=2058089 RepID=UPI00187C0DE5|nr:3'-5' exonuclease [Psychromonas sp. psych-6C06]
MLSMFNYFHPLNQLQRKRARYINKHKIPDHILALLRAPLPDIDEDLLKLDYIALDIETTGFHPETDHLLSIGYLPIQNQKILLSEAVEQFVKSTKKIKAETAIINHIVPEMLENGTPLNEILEKFFASLVGKVLVAHGSVIEKRFLDYYVAKQFNLPPLPLLWVDTLSIEKSFIIHKGSAQSADFRLSSTRERHGLPEYPAHGALIDALATAELYLALLKKRFQDDKATFRDLKIDPS